MVSKKKCSSYGKELALKHTTRSAVGLNACRWEQHEEDTPAYDVIDVPDPEPTPARKVKRTPHPKAKPRSKPRNTDLEFVQAPKKGQPKSKPKDKDKDKDKDIPSNLRSGLTSKHAKQLRAYNGSKRTKQRIEIYLKRGLSFSEAKKRAISRRPLTKDEETRLKDEYYVKNNRVGFEKLYASVRTENGKSKTGKPQFSTNIRQVQAWLSQQEVAQDFRYFVT